MTDFAPIDGRVGLSGAGGAGSAGESVARVRAASRGPEASSLAKPAPARQIVDEVDLSNDALAASGGLRADLVRGARERIASGFYDDPRVTDRTIDALIRDLVA